MRAIILILLMISGGGILNGAIFFSGKNSSSEADTATINALIRKGFINLQSSSKSKPAVAKIYIDSAVNILKKEDLDFPPALNLLQAGYYFSTGDYRSSEEEALLSMYKATYAGDEAIRIRSMIFLGKYYLKIGFYKESMNYYEQVIDLSRKKGFLFLVPKGYEGLAFLFESVGDVNGSQKNLKLMIDAAVTAKDTTEIIAGLLKLGTSFSDKNRSFLKADSLLKQSFRYAIIKKDTLPASLSLANLGWNFYAEKKYDSALYYYNRSLRLSIPGKQFGVAANSLGNIGTIYRDIGKTDSSIYFYNKSIDQARNVNDLFTLSWVHDDMSKMYLTKKDTGNAFKSYVLFKQFSDSLKYYENRAGLTDVKVRYEADTYNKEVQMLSLRLKNNRILVYAFSGFSVLAITIVLLLFKNSKDKAKRKISEMNHRISEITQANLRQQMNPHFIFNTLNSIQYYMYQHDKLATNNYLTKFASLMRKVLENSQHTSVCLRDELDALKLYLELECLRFKDKFDFKIKVDEEIDQLLYKVPAMIIQPYVENSISHGLMPLETKGFVNIDLKLLNSHILCTVEDNGIGRAAAMERNKLKEGNHNSLGTRIIESRLDLVNDLYGTSLKTVYTDLKDEKGEGKGTRVEIHIPIMI